MASRYWVGGTGNWNDTAHWSTSNGGASGAAVPTSSDDVFVTASSGFGAGGTISENGTTVECLSFTSTSGHNYNIKYVTHDLAVYGNVTLESGVTFTTAEESYLLLYGAGTHTFTANSATIYLVQQYGAGTYTLGSNLILTKRLTIFAGTFKLSSYSVTAQYLYVDNGAILYLGSGTFEVKPTTITAVNIVSGATVVAETSTIKINQQSAMTNEFTGSGQTFNNLWLTGTTGATLTIYDSNTFNEFKVDSGPRTVLFDSLVTQTVTSWNVNGTAGNLIAFTTNPTTSTLESSFGQQTGTTNLYSGSTTRASQSFSGNNEFIYNLGLQLKRTGSPSGSAYAKIYAHSGTFGTSSVPTGSALATSDALTLTDVTSGSFAYENFSFSGANRITLVSGTNYVITVEVTTGDASNYITLKTSTTKAEAGNYATYNGSWTASAGTDMNEYVITTGVDSVSTLSSATTILNSTYISLKDSTATGGALWYAGSGSTNVSNNTGWIFRDGFVPTGLTNAATFGTASFTTKITMNGFANENNLGVPRFYNGAGLFPDTLANTNSFGTATFTSTPAFTPTGLTNSNSFGTFTITRIKASSTEYSQHIKNRTTFDGSDKIELAYSSVLKNKTNYDKQ